jgi:hypothetical protein
VNSSSWTGPPAKILLDLITNSIEQSPSWEANILSGGPEIPRVLWNPKVHYNVHKRQLPGPILSQQMNTVHALTPKNNLNIIPPSTPKSIKWSLPVRISNYFCMHFLLCPTDHILLDLINIIFDEAWKVWNSSLCRFSNSCYFISPSSKYSSLHFVPEHPQSKNNFGFRGWAASNVENYPTFRQTLQLLSSGWMRNGWRDCGSLYRAGSRWREGCNFRLTNQHHQVQLASYCLPFSASKTPNRYIQPWR